MGLKYDSQKKLRKNRAKWKVDSWEEYDAREKQLLKESMRFHEPTVVGQVRIVAGKAKNVMIDIPKKTRPITDRMKTQIFDVLGRDILDLTVLDLYAGSGSFGLEALSRGAKSATFVDAAKHAEKILEDNIVKTGFLTETSVVKEKTEDYLTSAYDDAQVFELIFMDPPYKKYNPKKSSDLLEVTTNCMKLLPWVNDKKTELFKGAIIIKHPRHYDIELIVPEGMRTLETYDYGMNCISLLVLEIH